MNITAGLYDVTTYGTRGDGCTRDTTALQAAINDCAAQGGGIVWAPPGRYLTGTLWLKSHVELHLSAGAVLIASDDHADYNADNAFPENHVLTNEEVTGAHLIIAREAENVSITGQGTIDGASDQFFEALPPEEIAVSYRSRPCYFPIREWRPGQMIMFVRCKRVSVQDVQLINSPYWTLHCLGCSDVSIRGLTVTNHPQTRNGDGIDIDCCRNVTVSDCRISVGDDCITLLGNQMRLGQDMVCENAVISNCVLSSPCNAIRVGVGDATIRNCALSNIVITDTRTAINMMCHYGLDGDHGANISRIRFSDFVVDAIVPLHINAGHTPHRPAAIEDISFSKFTVRGSAGMYIGGTADVPLRNIVLNDWDMRLSGGTDNMQFTNELPSPFPLHGASGLAGKVAAPCALFADHVEALRLSDVRLRWDAPLGKVWRDAVILRDSNAVSIRDSILPAPTPNGESIRLIRSSEVDVA